jgi:hypothetical protein
MGHNMASWKVLEEMLIELEKEGENIPENILSDLRSAKSMILLHCTQSKGAGDVLQKAEELTANVEAYLAEEAQRVFGPEKVDAWLRRLEEANSEICEEKSDENKFITGVPRDQKWVRVEPTEKLSTEMLMQFAKEKNLQFNNQKDGRLLVYGKPESLRAFVKQMMVETNKK